MSWGEEQKKEIETIRERKITVKLSDADCDRLARKCGEHGLTIGELIENFVGDLVGGTYSNGSDERDYADQWFERCWFGMFPEPTLLNHLLNLGYEPEHYLDMLENVETIKSDIEITKQNIAEPSDEWKDIVYHKYNDDRTSYECVPCYNSVDEYIASEKEDLESCDTPTRVLANGRGFLRHGRTPQRAITSPLHPVTGLPLSRLLGGFLF